MATPIQNPYDSCSGVPNNCCKGLPRTLTATINDVENCSGLDEETIELKWDDDLMQWGGDKELCGGTWGIWIFCPAGAGDSCLDLEMHIGGDGNCRVAHTQQPEAGCTCPPDPLFLFFDDGGSGIDVNWTDLCECCENSGMDENKISITITR